MSSVARPGLDLFSDIMLRESSIEEKFALSQVLRLWRDLALDTLRLNHHAVYSLLLHQWCYGMACGRVEGTGALRDTHRNTGFFCAIVRLQTLELQCFDATNWVTLLVPSLENIRLSFANNTNLGTLSVIFARFPPRRPLAPALRELELQLDLELQRVLNIGFADEALLTVTGDGSVQDERDTVLRLRGVRLESLDVVVPGRSQYPDFTYGFV
ncbi:hypothetical protein C8R44DRAFT_873195 [Mycena epipterygia]|nr:hypothetical protein C8R44DRAFT_873195 [Mycena epipterygia]